MSIRNQRQLSHSGTTLRTKNLARSAVLELRDDRNTSVSHQQRYYSEDKSIWNYIPVLLPDSNFLASWVCCHNII